MPRKERMSRDSNVNSEMLVIYQRMSKCKESVDFTLKLPSVMSLTRMVFWNVADRFQTCTSLVSRVNSCLEEEERGTVRRFRG